MNYFAERIGDPIFLLTAAISWLLISNSIASAQEYKFRFNPPDNITFIQNVKTTKTTKVENASERVDVNEGRVKINIKKAGSGFIITMTSISVLMKRDGQIVNNPILDVMKDVVVTYEVDANGKLLRIRGYENVLERAKIPLPSAVIQSIAPLLSEEALVNKAKTEWSGRIEDFSDATVKIGDVFTASLPFLLPTGESITYYTVIKIAGQEKCGTRTCLKIETAYNSKPEALAKFAGKVIDKIMSEAKSKERVAVSGAEINGEVERLIDPETMLIYSETINRTIKMQVEIPGQGKANTVSEEKRVYSYEYTR